MIASTETFLESVIDTGDVSEADVARRRLRLGYPLWFILENEMDQGTILDRLSEASGIEALDPHSLQDLLDTEEAQKHDPVVLKARRWAPLFDGRVAIADPFGPLPNGEFDGRELCLAPLREIDTVLSTRFPSQEGELKRMRRLGRLLLSEGVITEKELALALDEQERSGGKLGEILLAQGTVDAQTITNILGERLGLLSVQDGASPEPILPAEKAREWRAVAIRDSSEEVEDGQENSVLPVAFTDPTKDTVEAVEEYLQRPVQPKIVDNQTFNALMGAVYADDDVQEVIKGLLEKFPQFSAFGRMLSTAQIIVVGILLLLLVIGVFVNFFFTAVVATALSSVLYILYTLYRLFTAWQGWRAESTLRPSTEELQSLDERELPVYTMLLPVYKEKPSTMRTLFEAIEKFDYPKHKLDGVLLIEADDDETQEAIEKVGKPGWLSTLSIPEEEEPGDGQGNARAGTVGKPGWLKVLHVPPGEPRTKPKAMIYGLLYARGDIITVYDAEDRPEPSQLKEAIWGFKQADDSVACLQAKLNYYNTRQNLLTRWFTLEYSAWFDMFLPGLHRLEAPIPLGGTSNHFRADVLKESLSWDPYNVTEDADLGLRLARLGKTTRMLNSTTYEEANSVFKNWLRQRSRWIKGYMQTFLVHTRNPLGLVQEIGAKNTAYFLATIGGLIYTVLASPIFWVLLVLWILLQPGWIPQLFPGPVYYLAMVNLFLGNFFFVFLALIGAVGRGQDDLAPHTLLIPVYWLMMSVAGYMALYELIMRPYYWQKTEHGLHFDEDSEASA